MPGPKHISKAVSRQVAGTLKCAVCAICGEREACTTYRAYHLRAHGPSYPHLELMKERAGERVAEADGYAEMPICDRCLEERRAASWNYWNVVLLVSIPLVAVAVGIVGLALAVRMLFGLTKSNKDNIGDWIVATIEMMPARPHIFKKVIPVEAVYDWKTRSEVGTLKRD